MKYAISNHIKKLFFYKKGVTIFVASWAHCDLARIIRGTPVMKNENSNSGIYDQFLVVFTYIKSSYISLNKIKPQVDERIYKNKQKSKRVFLLFL